MRRYVRTILGCGLVILLMLGCVSPILVDASEWPDMLTPAYYASPDAEFQQDVDRFLIACQSVSFHHPLASALDEVPNHTIPSMGMFGAQKGPDVAAQHHAAVDLHVGVRATTVDVFAAHDGVVSTYRDADKYRQYVSITRTIVDAEGAVLGKLVTLYAHVDLDLDEASGLSLDGQVVQAGDLISRHLYAGTVGGPHLHFEIRYYRPMDAGDEGFYSFAGPRTDPAYTESSAGPWPFGVWKPDVGYGFGDPRNHGLAFY